LTTVRAARYHSYGNPEVLVVEDAPEPHAGRNAIRIAVRATSVNQIDVMLRAGNLARVLPLDLPAVPGMDAAGVVDEVGPGVTDTQIGDVVFGLNGGISGTTAEFAVLTAWSAVPEQWTTAQAAAAGLAGATAATAIETLGDLKGATMLIDGASGAVGSAAAAFALAAGATVIGTGSRSSFPNLEAMGVVPTTYGPGLAERVAALAPSGVDAAVHSAPAPSNSLPAIVSIVGNGARVVTVLGAQEAAQLGAMSVVARHDSALLRAAAALGQAGMWTPRVDHEFPLGDIIDAHTAAESRSGKVTVTQP
jgi:NADPH:quinone reductase-like Zn-dependent oxidoreductase